MGILDGIVEWIAEQVMYGLDLINTSVLGALGCDMTTVLRYFPAAGFEITWMTRDLHADEPAWNIRTEHEAMYTAEGIPTKALIARKAFLSDEDAAVCAKYDKLVDKADAEPEC